MPRFTTLRPVHSEKEEITWSNIGQDAGTAAITINLAVGVQPGNKNIANEVPIGSKIRAIYLEFHFSAAQTGNVNVIHWIIGKEPFNTDLSNPNVYYQTDRRFIIKRGMEMLPANVATVFKRIVVVRIPPRMNRIGDDDKIIFKYQASSTQTINACGIAIYKVFT